MPVLVVLEREMASESDPAPARLRRLPEVMAVMARVGTLAFGGPAVHVAMLRDEVVRRRAWLADEEFLDLFGAVSILPGPSSSQLALVLCRRRAGWAGVLLGGACFIGPAMVMVGVLAWAYVRYGATPAGAGIAYGVEPVVVGVVAVALWDLGRRAAAKRWLLLVGAAALAAYFTGLSVIVILVAAGLVSAVVQRRPRAAATQLLVPFLRLGAAMGGPRHRPRLAEVALEFAKLGTVVFGSGYVLLAFFRRDLVVHLGWLTTRQVLDAVAAGQVTPGPVFTAATFVGYLLGGVPAALVATAAIFFPSFLIVAAFEPLIGRIRRSPAADAALEGITIGALGLMAGVTVDVARSAVHDPITALLAAGAAVVLGRWRPNAVWLVGGGAVVGIAHALL